jgi:hypothetical protein
MGNKAMKPAVCMKCNLFFKMKKGGVIWIEGKPINGKHDDTVWTPYKVWSSDLWECKGCGTQIVMGHGFNPISEDFKEGFQGWVDQSNFQVDDC